MSHTTSLRELERVVALVEKATPGYMRAYESTVLLGGIPSSGGFDIRGCPDATDNAKAIVAAVNFLREHGSALIAALGEGQEVGAVACGKCGVRQPLRHSPDCGRSSGVASAAAFAKPGDIDCLGFEDGHTYPGIRRHADESHTLPLYASPAHTSEVRDAARYRWIMDHAGVASYRGNVLVRFELDMQMPSWEGLDWEQVKRDAGSAIDAAMEASR